ncbi:hypothetical protein AX16_003876 [Volvariella volvacea WC 439]|nr:hypothetical protein AX16_003876 [Volvariella volvacea WC 439]
MQLVAFTAVLSFLASFWAMSTLATPVKEARQLVLPNAMCHPNFEGVGVSVTDSNHEWGTSPASVPHAPIINFSHRPSMLGYPDFRFEQNGQFPTEYIVKDVSHHQLVASVRDNELLLLHEQRDD